MARYRILDEEELKSLEKEFIDFLVLNGIPADEWIIIKRDPDKSQKMIESFSDVVFEKILREIKYLDHYSPQSIKTFRCDEKQIYLVGVDTGNAEIDFTTEGGIHQLKTNPPEDLQVYQTSKGYHPNREVEIYRMLQQGCQKSDGNLFQSLNSTIK